MNYCHVYRLLISHACNREQNDGYYEHHHIVPRSMGGSDSKTNIVKLTAREHFIAHCLLARMYGGTQWASVLRMKGNNRQYTNSRLYATARIQHAIVMSTINLGNLNAIGIRSEKTRTNISNSLKGKKKPFLLGNQHGKGNLSKTGQQNSIDTRTKISLSNKGRIPWNKGLSGNRHTEETKRKISFLRRCRDLNKLIDSVFIFDNVSLKAQHV